jgi:hypothetical protein
MAQIKDINATPIVSPENAKFLVLKNGSISRVELDTILQKIESFKPTDTSIIETNFANKIKEISTKFEMIEKELQQTQKQLEEVSGIVNAIISNAKDVVTATESTASIETAEEVSKAKSTKKSKKIND